MKRAHRRVAFDRWDSSGWGLSDETCSTGHGCSTGRPEDPHPFADLVFSGTLYVDMVPKEVPVLGASFSSAVGECPDTRCGISRSYRWPSGMGVGAPIAEPAAGLAGCRLVASHWSTRSDAHARRIAGRYVADDPRLPNPGNLRIVACSSRCPWGAGGQAPCLPAPSEAGAGLGGVSAGRTRPGSHWLVTLRIGARTQFDRRPSWNSWLSLPCFRCLIGQVPSTGELPDGWWRS